MADLYVDSRKGDDARGTGSSKEPFKTITHALDVASAGDTIIIRAGLYDDRNGETFPIRMKRDVNMKGETVTIGPHMLMVSAPDGNYHSLPVICGGATIRIDSARTTRFTTILGADGALFTRFVVFTTDSSATADDGVGILCRSTSPTIVDNSFRGDGHAGVTILELGHPRIGTNDFSKSVSNPRYGSRLRVFSMVYGITAHGEGEPTILENTIQCSNGIDITQVSHASVKGNVIQCEDAGIRIQNESSPTIVGNEIVGNSSYGIIMNDAPTPLIQGNYILENGSGGFFHGGVIIFHQASPDLGGGERESLGQNIFQDNRDWDLLNWSRNEIYALHNTWTHVPPAEIDRFDIYDDDESPMSGEVHFV